MLKIKDNVDLKELEKFGFRAKYDEDTGKIYKYHYEYNYFGQSNEYSVEIDIYLKDKILECYISGYKAEEHLINLLYDIIKADLVEKVDD